MIDGGYTNKKIIECILSQKIFKRFIGRFNKRRNIILNNNKIILSKYIDLLNFKKDFKKTLINGNEKWIHTVNISLTYGDRFKLVIILDEYNDIKGARPLITNMLDLSSETVSEYYALRWKEETYHQAIKDAFFCRTHKFRKAKTLSRYLEIINICYGLCEQRRHAKYNGSKTIFDIKNELLKISKEEFILNLKGRKLCKAKREAILSKFNL